MLDQATFREYFKAVHGHDPFPWQERLLEEVIVSGWPDVLALPTASGKTAVMDIALFAMVASDRRQPRRVFFVVDRRVVVDEAFSRANRIRDRLTAALDRGQEGVLGTLARRLKRLAAGSRCDVERSNLPAFEPLCVGEMRGGLPQAMDWATSPAQPIIVTTTVDQLGSRLLFRGYGLQTGVCNSLSIHAGLVGNDALIVLDEAHLSGPFLQTLNTVRALRDGFPQATATPWQVVAMTATPSAGAGRTFGPSQADFANPVFALRFQASKKARLVKVKSFGSSRRELEEQAAREAMHLSRSGANIVAVVVNRVRSARRIYESLVISGASTILVTGRIRPFDRDRLFGEFQDRLRADRERRLHSSSPMFVVATQTIEVGADFDFDALVTEIAPLDSLRQRFGRLDRLGRLKETQAVIVARDADVSRGSDDPVYGDRLAATWKWLEEKAIKPKTRGGNGDPVIDMGSSSLQNLLESNPDVSNLQAQPQVRVPSLLPPHVDLLSQTSPIAYTSPDVAVFLHGQSEGVSDVQLVWRADLTRENRDDWLDIVSLTPPSLQEALTVPLPAARRWLQEASLPEFGDLEGAGSYAPETEADTSSHRPFLVWHGQEGEDAISRRPRDIRPGDTIVVAATEGGCDRFGWAPESSAPVEDLVEAIALEAGKPVLRLHPHRLGQEFEKVAPLIAALTERQESGEGDIGDALGVVGQEQLPPWLTDSLGQLQHESVDRLSIIPYPDVDDAWFVGTLPRGKRWRWDRPDRGYSSSLSVEVSLQQHCQGVQDWASLFASVLGLPATIERDLSIAGRLHDLGKADPRFQLLLHGGDDIAWQASQATGSLLAKSGMDPRNRRAAERARRRAGYPRGMRHESLSLAMVEACPSLLGDAEDSELVLHLVASHHGCARPFLPYVEDKSPQSVQCSWDEAEIDVTTADAVRGFGDQAPERYWRLVRRYGWWGLAWLEAILRLADHRRSEEEVILCR